MTEDFEFFTESSARSYTKVEDHESRLTVDGIAKRHNVPVMPLIRTDSSVVKAGRHRQFLQDFDPKSRALEDYRALAQLLRERLGEADGDQRAAETA